MYSFFYLLSKNVRYQHKFQEKQFSEMDRIA